MIITQTPLRISFLGGGTDFADFYEREEGAVLSSAIDKYIFVIIKERFDHMIRVGYSRTELAASVDEVQHDLVRECLRKVGITQGVEISTMGDIPSEGSGLGSSSTVTVGLLNAMYYHVGIRKDPEALAREACEIEIGALGKPIGKQDQYIAAYGGLRHISFLRDGSVGLERLQVSRQVRDLLGERLMLFYTNISRKAETVLAEQVTNIAARLDVLRQMKALAGDAREALRVGALDDFGEIMHMGWEAKKTLASQISNGVIDDMYAAARRAGAIGGKIAGAGGGGFLLLYCHPANQDAVRAVLHGLREMPFKLEPSGSKVLFTHQRCQTPGKPLRLVRADAEERVPLALGGD